MHGIEIVAFVSSVGKIHLPIAPSTDRGQDEDDTEDAISLEFKTLLSTITRDEVDKHPTRCPQAETAERMTAVRPPVTWSGTAAHSLVMNSVSCVQKKRRIR